MARSHTRRRTRKTKLGSIADLETGRTLAIVWDPLPPRAWYKKQKQESRAFLKSASQNKWQITVVKPTQIVEES